MWDVEKSCLTGSKEQLNANKRIHTAHDIISQLPQLYYKDVTEPIIIDKCRTWTLRGNIDLLTKYVGEDYKIIVMERSLVDIVKSFARLYAENNTPVDLVKMIQPDTDPLMRPVAGLIGAKQAADQAHFFFIKYEDLISKPDEVMKNLYAFCGWAPFQHHYNNISVKHAEDDEFYGLKGFHQVRPNLEKRKVEYDLPEEVLKHCTILDMVLGYTAVGKDGVLTRVSSETLPTPPSS
jgi:hypothetical protein